MPHSHSIPVDAVHSAWVGKSVPAVVYVCVMIVVVVTTDLLFFRDHFWPRFAANAGIVLLFGAFYFRFMRR